MALLITKAEISKYREVAPGVRDDKINPYIEDAQNVDLQEVLPELLFNSLSDTPEAHTLLMDGGPYDYEGVSYKHPGLKKVLALFAFSRYILSGSGTDTPFGFVEKTSQNSQGVSAEQKRNTYKADRNLAYKYFAQVRLFMERTDYALFNQECKPSGSRFRFSKIS